MAQTAGVEDSQLLQLVQFDNISTILKSLISQNAKTRFESNFHSGMGIGV
jgi:hypothetical protein